MFASKDSLLTRPSGYNIARSVRLRSSATAYFNRTQTSGNRKTYTYSAWVKRGNLTTKQNLFGSLTAVPAVQNDQSYWSFLADNTFEIALYSGSDYLGQLITTQVFRDPSAWYHIVVQVDTTQATSSNRLKLYVNGIQVTSFSTTNYPTQNTDTFINANGYGVGIGRVYPYVGAEYFDGYQTEINFIDGQALTPSSFGSTNAITGVWQPAKYAGTYGTNGFYLNFSDNSNNTAATIGKDYSGNGNNWTPNNISVTAGVTYDSMVDSPTVGSLSSNYCVVNPLASGGTLSDGNLNGVSPSNTTAHATFAMPQTGKWYFECVMTNAGILNVGLAAYRPNAHIYSNTNSVVYSSSGVKNVDGVTDQPYGASYSSGDIIGIACDADSGTVTFYKNNTSQGSITHQVAGLFPSFGNGGASTNYSANFGQRPFTYTPPTNFVALNTYNLPASTIKNGAAYMAATTYTGNLTGQSITNTINGASFQPDFVWIKSRSAATDNKLTDSVRGATKAVISNTTAAETTDVTGVTAINSNGFTVGASTVYNNSAVTYVAWQWLAGASAGSSNTSGTITSTVSVGATQGFSVATFTGTGANATVGHGLGVAPKMVIVKNRASAFDWVVWHTTLVGSDYLILNATSAAATAATLWNSTTPTSSVFSVGTSTATNASGSSHVAYCFAAVAGYSAFGSYTGNGSADGPFVYLGFRPRWILLKKTSAAGNNWFIWDTSRDTYNVVQNYLWSNSASAEGADVAIDVLSNGFKVRAVSGNYNDSGGTYIYGAFAENAFKNSLAR